MLLQSLKGIITRIKSLGAIQFVDNSATSIVVSTTNSTALPASIIDDDRILAFLLHRSALTPPAGFTLLTSTYVGAFSNQLSVYQKTALLSDASTSPVWTQASSNRLILHYHVYRNTGGSINVSVINEDTSSVGTVTYNPFPMLGGSIPADVFDAVMIPCAAVGYALTGGTPTDVIASIGTLTTPSTIAENRLYVAYVDGVNDPYTLTGTWTNNMAGTALDPYQRALIAVYP